MVGSNLLRRLLIVYAFTLAAAPVSYLIRVLYARTLSVEAYGLFYAILAFFALLSVFNDFGTSLALVHYLPKFIRESAAKVRAAVFMVFRIEIVSATVIAMLIYLFQQPLATHFFRTDLASTILPIFAFVFLLQNCFDLLTNIFQGYRKEHLYASMNPVRLLIVGIFSYLIATLFDTNNLVAYAYIWIFSFLIVLIPYLIFLRKIAPELRVKITKRYPEMSAKLRSYGSFVMIGAVGSMLLSRIDVLMLTFIKGVESVGFYEIALPIASILLVFIGPITNVLFPNISHLYHTNQTGSVRKVLQAIYNTGFFLFIPISLILFLFPQEIIVVLFGGKFVPAKLALKILAIGFFFKGLYMLNFSIVDAIGKVKQKSMVIYVGAGLNIVLNALFIPMWSFEGAALATTLSFIAMFMLSMQYLSKFVQFRPSYINWVKTITNSVIFVGLVYFLKSTLDINVYVEAVAVIGISGIVYLAIGFLWGIIDYQKIKSAAMSVLKR